MTTADLHVTVIVPASIIAPLRKVGEVLGADTDGMFTNGLSASGNAPATHFISSGKIYPRFTTAIRNGDQLYDFVQERLAQNGKTIPYTRTQVKNALLQCDISTDPPFDAMARLGLRQLVPTL